MILQSTETGLFVASHTGLGTQWTERQDWAQRFPEWRVQRFLDMIPNTISVRP